MDRENPLQRVAVYDTMGLEEEEDGIKISELCDMLEGKLEVNNQRLLRFMYTFVYFIALITSNT